MTALQEELKEKDVAVGPAKESSRASRPRSFAPGDFPLPSGREEEWRFTPLDRVARALSDEPTDGRLTWTVPDLPAGVQLTAIAPEAAMARTVQAPGDRASALAVAGAGEHRALTIAPGSVVTEPLVLRLSGEGPNVPLEARGHLLIEVGAGAQAVVVVEHGGLATYCELLSVDVADNASLNLVLLQLWDPGAVHVGEVVARLGRDARLTGTVVTLGGDVVRLNTAAAFADEGGSIDLHGLYFADASQHLEHQLFIDHAAPRCRSRVTYKGALQGRDAHTVWVGDVLIRAVAEGTNTYEQNRNLVLTDGARADSVPNLEIETGLIEGAGHASATGRFDDEQLFYLCSRGIPEVEARRLVVRGFFADLVRQIGVPEVEARLLAIIEAELATSMAEFRAF
ncbi:MAG: Fe-S cluster assembly protein SufD [Micrococcales bacterium]|nr:Fe-S cluster assembly protein SufD [Micrococcales bacterium]